MNAWFVVYKINVQPCRYCGSPHGVVSRVVGPFATEESADEYAWKNFKQPEDYDWEVVEGTAT